MAIGSVWQEDAWADATWEPNTWAGASTAPSPASSDEDELIRATHELVKAANEFLKAANASAPSIRNYT